MTVSEMKPVLFARLWMKRMRDACSQTGERCLQRVARKRVCVFVWSQTAAQPHRRHAVNRRHQNSKRDVGFRLPMQQSRVDDALDVRRELSFQFVHETKTLPVLADRRHGSVEEHQCVIFGMRLAELIEAPETAADSFDGI